MLVRVADDHDPNIVRPKPMLVCKLCGRSLKFEATSRRNGRVSVLLQCPVHGTLKDGDRYLTGWGG